MSSFQKNAKIWKQTKDPRFTRGRVKTENLLGADVANRHVYLGAGHQPSAKSNQLSAVLSSMNILFTFFSQSFSWRRFFCTHPSDFSCPTCKLEFAHLRVKGIVGHINLKGIVLKCDSTSQRDSRSHQSKENRYCDSPSRWRRMTKMHL